MLKPILTTSAFLLLSHLSLIGQYSNADQYIEQYKALAISEMSRTGIPASIKMGQAILESAAGMSTLATKANNHFGVKCGSVWQGDNYGLKDDERVLLFFKKKSCFRKYNNAEESYMDHSAFLLRPNSPYASLFDLDKTDYKAWAYGLKKAGYATAGDYPEKLIGIIERYHLYQLDNLTNSDVVSNYKPKATQVVTAPKVIEPKDRIILINQIKAIVAKEGETPTLLARATNTNLSNIMEYNDYIQYSTEALNENDIVFLQKKKKTYWGKNKTHTIADGDNMFGLSQQYGVQLKMLYERNGMNPEMEPAVGQTIYLRGDRPENDKIKVVPKNQAPIKSRISDPVVYQPEKRTLISKAKPLDEKPIVPQKAVTENRTLAKKILISNEKPQDEAIAAKDDNSELFSRVESPQDKMNSAKPLSSKSEKQIFIPKTQSSINRPAPVNLESENLDFTMEPTENIEPITNEQKTEPRFKPALTGAGFTGTVKKEYQSSESSTSFEQIKNDEDTEVSSNNLEYYTVSAGDTLYNISKRYETTVESLKDLNSLSDNNIKLGQKLKLK